MSERFRKNLIKFGIGFGLCAVYIVYHCVSNGISKMAPVDLYRTLSDAFTVPGLLCIFFGLIFWLANEGAFNGIGYVLRYAVQSLIFLGRRGAVEKYKDYVEKQEKKKTKGYSFLFVIGAVCIVISLVFILLYSKA